MDRMDRLLQGLPVCYKAVGGAGGWFARDAGVLRRVGDVLLTGQASASRGGKFSFQRWLVAEDAFDLADADTTKAIFEVICAATCPLLHDSSLHPVSQQLHLALSTVLRHNHAG